MRIEDGVDLGSRPDGESRLEGLAVYAIRLALLLYLLPALCVALLITCLILVLWRIALLAESVLFWIVSRTGHGRGRPSEGSWSGEPIRSHIISTTYRTGSCGDQAIRRDRPSSGSFPTR